MEAALDKRALEPVLIDVSAMGSYTDFIGIVSGRSDRQVDAIAENISQVLKARGLHPLGQEGTGSGRWTLLDFGAFVIHVFYHPVREFYDLESLWIEAPRVKLDVPPDAVLQQPRLLVDARLQRGQRRGRRRMEQRCSYRRTRCPTERDRALRSGRLSECGAHGAR